MDVVVGVVEAKVDGVAEVEVVEIDELDGLVIKYGNTERRLDGWMGYGGFTENIKRRRSGTASDAVGTAQLFRG